jgi:hypothetical protein
MSYLARLLPTAGTTASTSGKPTHLRRNPHHPSCSSGSRCRCVCTCSFANSCLAIALRSWQFPLLRAVDSVCPLQAIHVGCRRVPTWFVRAGLFSFISRAMESTGRQTGALHFGFAACGMDVAALARHAANRLVGKLRLIDSSGRQLFSRAHRRDGARAKAHTFTRGEASGHHIIQPGDVRGLGQAVGPNSPSITAQLHCSQGRAMSR